MSFRLRLILGILRWLRGPRIDVTKGYRGEYFVWPTEGELRVVENARYSYFLGLERIRPIFATNLWRICRANGWTAVMGTQIYKVKRSLRRWQRFSVITSPLSWDEKWIYFEQRIESRGKPVCNGVIAVIFLGKDRKIPPAEVLALIGVETPSPALSVAVLAFKASAQTLESQAGGR